MVYGMVSLVPGVPPAVVLARQLEGRLGLPPRKVRLGPEPSGEVGHGAESGLRT